MQVIGHFAHLNAFVAVSKWIICWLILSPTLTIFKPWCFHIFLFLHADMAEYIPGSFTRTFFNKHGLELKAINSCEVATQEVLNTLQSFYHTEPFSSDLDLVVFGSIFRNEFTEGSDVDWTLLIDGQADARHLNVAKNIEKKIEENRLGKPSPAGAFGSTTISHDLVHHIGGENDTNQNITRRVLLLLESKKIIFSPEQTDGTAYSRVVNAVLEQYVNHDSGLQQPDKDTIPKFLFNDIVRFWRTMCVDFANKQKDQGGQKWAMRNIKLRMSRKLLFVKGMLMCFSQYKKHKDLSDTIIALRDMVKLHPFELLLSLQEHFAFPDDDLINLFTYYDKFLSFLRNPEKRKHLTNLGMADAFTDTDYIELKKIGDGFKKTLDQMFIYKEGKLSKLTLKYGIF
jgi:predicted nucleotidyltransferase